MVFVLLSNMVMIFVLLRHLDYHGSVHSLLHWLISRGLVLTVQNCDLCPAAQPADELV